VWQVEALLSIASSKFKGVRVCKASSTKRNNDRYSCGTLWHVFALARSFQNPKLLLTNGCSFRPQAFTEFNAEVNETKRHEEEEENQIAKVPVAGALL
jgi:hypothetical protein